MFSKTKTIPGTCSFHNFIQKSTDRIAITHIHFNSKFSTIFDFANEIPFLKMMDISTNDYIMSTYYDNWYFGLV